MIKDRHIKPHDFVSGKPKSPYRSVIRFRPPITTNPCREITLGVDPVDCVLGQGFEAGELGITMAPPSTGKSQIIERFQEMLTEMRDRYQPVNMDYAQLYPEIQRTYNYTDIRPEGYENWTDTQKFAHKIMLNSSY
jgi:hypothetical protein